MASHWDVLLNTPTEFIHVTELSLSPRLALISREPVPAAGLDIALCDPVT